MYWRQPVLPPRVKGRVRKTECFFPPKLKNRTFFPAQNVELNVTHSILPSTSQCKQNFFLDLFFLPLLFCVRATCAHPQRHVMTSPVIVCGKVLNFRTFEKNVFSHQKLGFEVSNFRTELFLRQKPIGMFCLRH